jgi:hypothetical protein
MYFKTMQKISLPSTTLNISLLFRPSWLFITRGGLLGRIGLQTYFISLTGREGLSKWVMLCTPLYRLKLSVILLRLLLEKRKFTIFPEGEVGVCAVCAVHAEAHVAVEVVIPKAVVLPQILSQKSARKLLVIVRSPFLNIVSVHLASKQIGNVKGMRLTTRTLAQMLQKKFALKGSGKTRRNVLRRQLKGVTQSQHMRAS